MSYLRGHRSRSSALACLSSVPSASKEPRHPIWRSSFCCRLRNGDEYLKYFGDIDTRTMGGKVGNASYGIALDFYVRAKHLPNERFKTTQFDNEQFIVG